MTDVSQPDPVPDPTNTFVNPALYHQFVFAGNDWCGQCGQIAQAMVHSIKTDGGDS